MNLAAIKEHLSQKEAAERTQQTQSYRDLVDRLADDEPVEPDTVEAVLETLNNKTLDNLEADVLTHKQRRGWKVQLDRLSELEIRQRQIERERQQAQQAVDEAVKQRAAVNSRTAEPLAQIQAERTAAENARRQLQSTCADPDLCTQLDQVDDCRKQLTDRCRKLRDDLWGQGMAGDVRDAYQNTTGHDLWTYLARLVDYPALMAGQHAAQGDDPDGSIFDPDSSHFQACLLTRDPKQRPLFDLSPDWKPGNVDRASLLDEYRAFYHSTAKPLIEEFFRNQSELKHIDAVREQILEQMLQP